MNISEISNNLGLGKVTQGQEARSCWRFICKYVKKCNWRGQSVASECVRFNGKIATSKVANLQAVQRIEEAELSLKLALEVKTKALNAYKEIA